MPHPHIHIDPHRARRRRRVDADHRRVLDPPAGGGAALSTRTTVVSPTHTAGLDLDTDRDGRVDPVGPWTWTVTITDALGNSTAGRGTIDVESIHCT